MTTNSKYYPIAETFHSLQGEGAWSGGNAFFIRLGGCDVHCPWCDQKETWNQQRHPLVNIETLVSQASKAKPAFVVITGGEPLMHDLAPLCQALGKAGLRRHLETSGAYSLTGEFEWVTFSPKPYKPPEPELYAVADELKIIIQSPSDLLWAEQQSAKVFKQIPRFLQPEWETPDSQEQIIQYIKTHPQWRLSLQNHKYLAIR